MENCKQVHVVNKYTDHSAKNLELLIGSQIYIVHESDKKKKKKKKDFPEIFFHLTTYFHPALVTPLGINYRKCFLLLNLYTVRKMITSQDVCVCFSLKGIWGQNEFILVWFEFSFAPDLDLLP